MTPRRVVIVGGVAGGMSTATRLRRLDERAVITVIERSGHVSYANCGLPYFVGGVIGDEEDLLLQTPDSLFDRFRLDVRIDTEVIAIDARNHEVTMRSTLDGRTECLGYDKLVLSPCPRPATHTRLRPGARAAAVEDAEKLAADVAGGPRSAVIIGAGFIGLETAENLAHRSIAVTVVEAVDQVLTPLDPELAILVAAELTSHGVVVETGVAVSEVTAGGVTLGDGRLIPGELVVGSIGVRPDVRLADMAGLVLSTHGAIAVDEVNRTSDPDIYAVGDAVEKGDWVGGGNSLIALANIANRQGRRVADHICGLPRARTVARDGHRQGVRPHCGHDGMEREEAPGRRDAGTGRCTRIPSATPATTRAQSPWRSKLLFDPDDGTSSGLRRSARRVWTSGSMSSPPP